MFLPSSCPLSFSEKVNDLTQQVSQLTSENESLHEKLSEMEKRVANRDAELRKMLDEKDTRDAARDAVTARLGLMLSELLASGGLTSGKSIK